MDLSEFSDIYIDHLLDSSAPLQDGQVTPYRQVPLTRINENRRTKRSRLAERIAQNDELVRQVKQLQFENKQLADLKSTAQEVTSLYQKEKQQRIELEKRSAEISERCGELEKELDAQVLNCENLQEELQLKGLPVDTKDVLPILMQLVQRRGEDSGFLRRENNILKKLKDHCRSLGISVPPPKSPSSRSKRKISQLHQSTQTDEESAKTKPVLCSVAVQVEDLIETRNQGTQHKNTTTTRGTTTASFIRKHHVGTCFPEPKPLPNVRQILDEMLSWRNDMVIEPMSPLSDPQSELDEITSTASVATCTTLCDIHREIDFISERPSQIKVSASRPPSRSMLDNVKEEARSSREMAKELLNFLPQNQNCLANLPPQAFEELWQVFGQMVLGLLQRRSNSSLATPPSVSQADFTNWLYELYEGTQWQSEQIQNIDSSKRDFALSTECMDVGTDPIIESPNISHGGDVTPIRLPTKPRDRKRKSKKRKAIAIPKPISKRNCLEILPIPDQNSLEEKPICEESNSESEGLEHEQKPETAIQFLSNLNTFNMPNCDNLDMELDEEELYLLLLTSNAKKQKNNAEIGRNKVPGKPVENAELILNGKNASNASLKDAQNRNCIKQQQTEVESLDEPQIEIDEKEKINSVNFRDSEDSDTRSDPPLPSSEHDPQKRSRKSVGVEKDLFVKCYYPDDQKDSILPNSKSSLFGSDSDMESDSSERQMDLEVSDSEDDFQAGEEESRASDGKEQSKEFLFGSDSDLDEKEEHIPKSAVSNTADKQEVVANEIDKALPDELQLFGYENCFYEQTRTKNEENVDQVRNASESLHLLAENSETEILLTDSQMPEKQSIFIQTAQLSDESEDEHSLVIDEEIPTSQLPFEIPSPLLVPAKRKRTKSEIRTPSPPEEVRLTRQRAKQLLNEQKSVPENGPSLVEQIRNQLRQALSKPESLKNNIQMDTESVEQMKKKPETEEIELHPIQQAYTFSEESPASPVPQPIEECVNPPIEIPLEQSACPGKDGQLKSILEHVVQVDKGLDKLNKTNRKTLGKAQPQLCAAIGNYLQETMQLESSCSDLAMEIYKVTKDEAVVVNAMITVICKIGVKEEPVDRLLNALKYFDFTQRFLCELEERLFRNTKERPAIEVALNYVKLYLKAVALQTTLKAGYENPARLLLAKILYHFDRDMPSLVIEVMREFPTVMPHREQRAYDNSDPLITVIKHLLMTRKYDMHDPESADRQLLSKLRFEYHFQPFEPTKQQVLENLVGKLKAGRLEQLGYAFALFCRRSTFLNVLDSVLGEHLMPLATSYCDLATQDKSYDDRLVVVLQCISLVLKPLPLDTDISAFVGLLKRLLVAVPRPGVQMAAAQACLRLQRFGFKYIFDVLKDYRPSYEMDSLTRAMLRCFAERRRQFRSAATTGKSAKT